MAQIEENKKHKDIAFSSGDSAFLKVGFSKENRQKGPSKETHSEFEKVPDMQLWTEFKRGSEAAFIFMYKKYFPQLYSYGFQFTNDHEFIQDCIQDLFIEIRKKRKNLSDTDCIKLYLFKILRRKIISAIRRRNNLKAKDISLQEFDVTFSIEHHLINQQLTQEKIEGLNRALENLSNRQKEAVYYFYYENFSYKEIAEMMDMAHVRSARNLIYRALDLLKTKLPASLKGVY